MLLKEINQYTKYLGIEKPSLNLENLELLIRKHIEALCFTSIPVLLKEEISLEYEAIVEKLIVNKRGGYCFEHNKLIYENLLAQGYDVKPLFARVLNNRKVSVPKTHRLTLLYFEDERYLVDVGFGYASPSAPIKFTAESTTTHTGIEYKIETLGDECFELHLFKDGAPYVLYSFDLNDASEEDFELSHFYSHKHPKANFVNHLVLSKILDDEILSLRNGLYQKISKEGMENINVSSVSVLEEILRDEFDYPICKEEVTYLYEKYILRKD